MWDTHSVRRFASLHRYASILEDRLVYTRFLVFLQLRGRALSVAGDVFASRQQYALLSKALLSDE